MRTLRYKLAGMLLDRFYREGTDMYIDRPYIYAIAYAICPGGIPDNW